MNVSTRSRMLPHQLYKNVSFGCCCIQECTGNTGSYWLSIDTLVTKTYSTRTIDRVTLTVLAVDSIKAWLALADVLAKDVASAGLARHLTDGIIHARVGITGPWRRKRKKRQWRESQTSRRHSSADLSKISSFFKDNLFKLKNGADIFI